MKISDDQILTGEVWPNDAVYPDHSNPATGVWWRKWLSKMYQELAFDGLWEDMNEASNFCQGTCY